MNTQIIALVTLALILTGCTTGSHTGYVTATESSGFIWVTDDAYIKTDTQSSQEDRYCVQDDRVFEDLREFQTSRERVTVRFSDDPLDVILPWRCSGGAQSVIRSVSPAGEVLT